MKTYIFSILFVIKREAIEFNLMLQYRTKYIHTSVYLVILLKLD
jgi:hypothetical protein